MASLLNNAPTSNGNATFSLLNFASDASSSIQEAFSKPAKKRKVNIRKYIQKRVKRLNGPSASNKGVRSANEQQTKSKSALNKTPQRRSPPAPLTSHSQSLPVLNCPIVSNSDNAHSLQFSYSDSNLYRQLPQFPVANPDSALDDIMTVLGLENTTAPSSMSRCSSDSMVDVTTYIPPQSILESQLPLAEHPLIDHPYSPYSDCSDELFEDSGSAYSSPCSSGSYNCSPVPPPPSTQPSCKWTPPPANSPPMMTPAQYPITSACNWIPRGLPASTVAGCNYLPYHQSPPCDQVLLSPTIWECMNYPENF